MALVIDMDSHLRDGYFLDEIYDLDYVSNLLRGTLTRDQVHEHVLELIQRVDF